MKRQPVFVFVHSLLCGVVCLILLPGASASPQRLIIGGLALGCLLGVRLLLQLADKVPWLCLLLLVAALAVGIPYGGGMLPFAGVLLAQGTFQLAGSRPALPLSTVAIVLLGVAIQPPVLAMLITPLCVVPLFFLDDAFDRLAAAHEQLTERAEENTRLRNQLAGQRKMTGSMERAARINERNRLAARIHDEVGHGVSGSVLLLEGARLQMDKDPNKAKAALEAATENLRAAVDDIRDVLRQERAGPGETGLAQLSAILTTFEARHAAIHTSLTTEGELADISPLVWVCIQENLSETLTNLLKHSNAHNFTVSIAMQNRLVKVAFQDDGMAKDFKPGLGMAAMEERCALCHGNCFFSASPRGFSTVMTFTRLNSHTAVSGGDAE